VQYSGTASGDKELFFPTGAGRGPSAPRAIAVDNNTVILQSAGGLTASPQQASVVISSTPPPTQQHSPGQSHAVIVQSPGNVSGATPVAAGSTSAGAHQLVELVTSHLPTNAPNAVISRVYGSDGSAYITSSPATLTTVVSIT
jgi:hypothetical protein